MINNLPSFTKPEDFVSWLKQVCGVGLTGHLGIPDLNLNCKCTLNFVWNPDEEKNND